MYVEEFVEGHNISLFIYLYLRYSNDRKAVLQMAKTNAFIIKLI